MDHASRLRTEVIFAAVQVKDDVKKLAASSSGGQDEIRIRIALVRVVALAEAHLLASGKWRSDNPPDLATIDEHAKLIGVDLPDLRRLVRDMR